MSERYALGLFEGFGVELEYMIVDRETFDVRPVADALMGAAAGQAGSAPDAEIERGALAWSNELALHLIEFKTNGPAPALRGLAERFQESVAEANALLEALDARLLPGAMHPWMDPDRELALWPHEYGPVYRTYDRIFGCRGHGWANLQSTHLNLPFADDEEFGRLHAALRLVLPLLPALAASSPIVDGRVTGVLDNRLAFYRQNSARVPSVTGSVIPEPVFHRADYEERILGRIYRDLAPHDPEGVLHHEWVNARGAIARFDRGSIEIRVIDVQECPAADLAIAAAAAAVARALAEGAWSAPADQRACETAALDAVLESTAARGGEAAIEDPAYLRLLGFPRSGGVTARALWRHLLEATGVCDADGGAWEGALETLLEEGCLAQRMLARAGTEPSRDRLRDLCAELAACLAEGRMLRAAA